MVDIVYLGHSAFLLESSKGKILIDPFITGNPLASAPKDLKPDLILVTHAHGDHLGDAIEISKKTRAPVHSTFEIANYASSKGAKSIDGHIGGTLVMPFCSVKIFPALHGSSVDGISSVGIACSFVISTDGKAIYHAGDTALFGDMKLIGEEFKIDMALLPIGGHYTMGIDDAVRATAMLNSKFVIPMHYNTFDPIRADPEEFRRKVESKTRAKCIILRPGDRYRLV